MCMVAYFFQELDNFTVNEWEDDTGKSFFFLYLLHPQVLTAFKYTKFKYIQCFQDFHAHTHRTSFFKSVARTRGNDGIVISFD